MTSVPVRKGFDKDWYGTCGRFFTNGVRWVISEGRQVGAVPT